MNSSNKLQMHGSLTLTVAKANGDVETIKKDNIIVDVGFDFIADAIGKSTDRPGCMSHIAVGSSDANPIAANTALGLEVARVAALYEHTAGTKSFTFTSTFAPGVATGALTEAAVVNDAAGGILLDRVKFAVINKGADDTVTAVFTFNMS